MRRAALLTAALSLAILGSPVASASALTPTLGQVVPHGTMVEGQCTLTENVESGRKTYWEIDGVIPAFKHGGSKGGVELAPRAEDTPRLAHTPTDVFGGSYVVVPNLMAAPQRPSGNCAIQSFDPLQAVTMEEAGPHVFVQYDESVHFVWVPDGSDDPVPQPCPLNDLDFPSPGDVNPPTQPDTGGHWAADTFCNATGVTGFYVTAASACPISGDMSQWPTSPYISQYDAGARLNLPLGSGRRGGNACGPSSLLMAMLSGGATGLPSLEDTFDATMRLDRVQVQPNGENVFWGDPRGVALARSLGFRQARTRSLGTDVQGMERQILNSLHVGGGNTPVVISTAFGGARWGVTGGGHMIAIVGADGRGGWIVDDPAGNYFSTPKAGYSDTSGGHYGPGSCGHRAVYPHFWLLAYTTGRWLLELGPRTVPPPPPRSAGAHAAAEASLGSAFSVADANPGGADAPTSFYLQDASGKRAGWIDGQAVEEIPDSAVGQDPPGFTDPATGDDSIGPTSGDPPPTPRSIVVNGPASAVTLHVVQGAGATFALRAESWDSGKRTSSAIVTGTGTGADATAALPAPTPTTVAATAKLAAAKAKVKKRVVSVPLTCTAPAGSSCSWAIALTAKKGRRTVTIAKRAGTLAGGKKLTVKLKPSAAGRRLLKSKRRVSATLTVTQKRAGAKPVVVRRQKLKV